jgi:hypothetical protein
MVQVKLFFKRHPESFAYCGWDVATQSALPWTRFVCKLRGFAVPLELRYTLKCTRPCFARRFVHVKLCDESASTHHTSHIIQAILQELSGQTSCESIVHPDHLFRFNVYHSTDNIIMHTCNEIVPSKTFDQVFNCVLFRLGQNPSCSWVGDRRIVITMGMMAELAYGDWLNIR